MLRRAAQETRDIINVFCFYNIQICYIFIISVGGDQMLRRATQETRKGTSTRLE